MLVLLSHYFLSYRCLDDELKMCKWESVKCCIHGLNRLDLHSIIRLRRVSFYRRIELWDSQLLSNVFLFFFVDSQPNSDILAVFRRHGDVMFNIWNDFKLISS